MLNDNDYYDILVGEVARVTGEGLDVDSQPFTFLSFSELCLVMNGWSSAWLQP